jgi:hypothetical protein
MPADPRFNVCACEAGALRKIDVEQSSEASAASAFR